VVVYIDLGLYKNERRKERVGNKSSRKSWLLMLTDTLDDDYPR
jgi:hypothetical protein